VFSPATTSNEIASRLENSIEAAGGLSTAIYNAIVQKLSKVDKYDRLADVQDLIMYSFSCFLFIMEIEYINKIILSSICKTW
jgi:hypothetical protein